jgi:PncC family amidohydrolase
MEEILEVVSQITHRIVKQNATLMVAESATGGLVQYFLTQLSGSSEFYKGGIVAYSNELKQRLLQVPESTITQFGAVSGETVAAMANGIRLWMKTDYGLATSGIAGPTGGTPEKPVGLVFIAVSHRTFETIIQQHTFTGTRRDNRLNFSHTALQLLLDSLLQEE